MDFRTVPEWERALSLLGEIHSLTISLVGEEERYLASMMREAGMRAVVEVAQGTGDGGLGLAGKEAARRQLICLIACLEMAIKLSLGSREANSDLLTVVNDFARQLEG